MCSCCRTIKKDLKLPEYIYEFIKCAKVMNRDYNASINLANYKHNLLIEDYAYRQTMTKPNVSL